MFIDDPFGPPVFFQVFIAFIFIAVIGIFIFVIGKGITSWMSNNASPVLVERVKVLSKRSEVYGGGETSASTAYYVTFGLESSGERIELQVSGTESGLLVEEDKGDLTFQGTRYQGFRRISE